MLFYHAECATCPDAVNFLTCHASRMPATDIFRSARIEHPFFLYVSEANVDAHETRSTVRFRRGPTTVASSTRSQRSSAADSTDVRLGVCARVRARGAGKYGRH